MLRFKCCKKYKRNYYTASIALERNLKNHVVTTVKSTSKPTNGSMRSDDDISKNSMYNMKKRKTFLLFGRNKDDYSYYNFPKIKDVLIMSLVVLFCMFVLSFVAMGIDKAYLALNKFLFVKK